MFFGLLDGVPGTHQSYRIYMEQGEEASFLKLSQAHLLKATSGGKKSELYWNKTNKKSIKKRYKENFSKAEIAVEVSRKQRLIYTCMWQQLYHFKSFSFY